MDNYLEPCEEILKGASIAVSVITNGDVTDMEMLPLAPTCLTDAQIHERVVAWRERGLRFIGVIALADGRTKTALTEPLDARRFAALSKAFGVYVDTMRALNLGPAPQYDWTARRYQ